MNACPRSTLISRLATTFVVASLLTTPMLAAAAPSLSTPTAKVPQAQKKGYAAGKKAFDAMEYARAGDEWAAVLAGIPESKPNQATRMYLVLDTIASYREAFASDGNVAHLNVAMDTYYAYFKAYKDEYGSPSIPRPVVDARHALKDELKKADAKGSDPGGSEPASTGTNDNGSSDTGSDTTDTTDNSTDSSTTQSADDPPASSGGSDAGGSDAGTSGSVSTANPKADKSGTPLIAAGAAVLAVGVGASSLIAVGSVEGKRARFDHKLPGYDDDQRDAIDKRGRNMNAVFIAGLVATPVLVGTGVALIVVGLKKKKENQMQASIVPLFRGGLTGVAVRGKF